MFIFAEFFFPPYVFVSLIRMVTLPSLISQHLRPAGSSLTSLQLVCLFCATHRIVQKCQISWYVYIFLFYFSSITHRYNKHDWLFQHILSEENNARELWSTQQFGEGLSEISQTALEIRIPPPPSPPFSSPPPKSHCLVLWLSTDTAERVAVMPALYDVMERHFIAQLRAISS